uniref:Claudin n=1 Tax=Callorhinchus milii TaxID=7868 RepID=A0A4W3H610_CALMI
MATTGLQVFAIILSLLALIGATVVTVLPNWKVNTFEGSNIISSTIHMQGLWTNCTWTSTGLFSCKYSLSILAQPAYIRAARTMMVLSCIVSILGIGFALPGMKCTRWIRDQQTKSCAAITGGASFIIAGTMCLVPVSCFTAGLISQYFKPSTPEANKYEIGGAIYAGFISPCYQDH